MSNYAKRPPWSAGKLEPWFDRTFPIEWVQILAKVVVFTVLGLLTATFARYFMGFVTGEYF